MDPYVHTNTHTQALQQRVHGPFGRLVPAGVSAYVCSRELLLFQPCHSSAPL